MRNFYVVWHCPLTRFSSLAFWICYFLLGAMLPCNQSHSEMVTYAIGNSLTNDFYFPYTGKGFDLMTSTTSNPTRTGVHLNCSQSLSRIWANPNETCLTTAGFGTFQSVLAGPVDNVLFQPHWSEFGSVGQEIQMIKNFIDLTKQNPANSDTRFFLYAPWGARLDAGFGQPFYDSWYNFPVTLSGSFVQAKSTYDLMMHELTQSGYEISLIPVGQAWASTIDAIRGGTAIELINTINGVQSPGTLAEAQLWRDANHASSVGSFIAATSVYAAIYGTEPVGFDPTLFSFQAFNDYRLSPTGGRQIEQIVWSTYLASVPEPSSFMTTCIFLTSLIFARRRASDSISR